MMPFRALILAVAFAGLHAPQEDDEDAPRNTALVRVYPGLDQLVTKADSLAAEGRFEAALEIYAAAGKHPNALVPLQERTGPATRYVGVLEFCLRKIASWPAEGRTAARRFADPLARQAFRAAQAAKDPQAAAEVALRYPHSSFADDALALLGSLHLEAGRPGEAAEAFERLLALPDADVPKAVAFARLGAAYAAAGRRDSLASLVARADLEAAGARVLLGDREAALSDALRDMLRTAPEAPLPAAEGSSWEMMQGSPSGVRVAEAAELGPRAWASPIAETRYEVQEDWMGGVPAPRPGPQFRPVFPAVSDGLVYFHTEFAAYACNLYGSSGEPLWTHRLQVPPGELMFEERLVHAATVADGRVYVNLVTALGEQEVQQAYIKVKFPFPKRALFCLDAYTGKVLWRLGGSTGPVPFEEGLSFSVPPTPHGGLLYAGVIRQAHSTDPFEHHVVCLDPATGHVLWSTFVASGGTEINLFGNSTRESLGSPVAVEGGSVYYATNHGALAALDRTTGRLRWVFKYRQLPVSPTRQIHIRRNALEWHASAPVVAQGCALFAPTDSKYLYALDASTGEQRWWRPRGDGRSIAGCDGVHLVVSGDGIEWLALANQGKLAGRFEPPAGRPAGRAAVTRDGVYFPTTDGLYRVALNAKGVPRSDYTAWRGSRLDGGNVIVAEGAVVVAGAGAVEVYLNRRDMDRTIEADLAKYPDHPAVLYRAALRLLQSGKDSRAAELLGRVIELTSRSARPADGRLGRAARKRLFGLSKDAGQAAMDGGNPAEAAAAFRRARAAAPDAASMVEASTLLAGAAAAQKDYSTAIAEYHRLIQELGDEVVAGRRVFDVARLAIAQALAAGGREPYRPFETEAEQRLARAEAAASPDALLEIFRTHPNSAAAERAVLGAAEAHARLGKPDDAVAALRLFLREFPASARALDAQASLVVALEKRSRFASAAAVLRKMSSAGDREVTVEGKRVSVRAFVEARVGREEYRAASATAPPVRLKPPLSKAGAYVEKEFVLGGAVLRPEGPALTRGSGLLFMNYGGAVKGIDPVAGSESWRIATDAPVRAAFVHEDALLLCSDSFVARVHPVTGAVEWKHSSPVPMRGFCRAGAMICYLAPDPGSSAASIVALDASKGGTAWSQTYAGIALSGVLPADDHVAFVTVAPARLLRFEIETGRAAPQSPLASAGPGMKVLGAAEGVVVLQSESSEVQACDLSTGKPLWRNGLDGWSVSVTAISRAGLFVAGTYQGLSTAALIDLRNGKLRGLTDRLDGIPGTPVAMDDRRVAFATRGGDRAVKVRALDLSDSRMREAWSLVPDRRTLQSVPLLAEGTAAVLHLAATPEGKFEFSADLLDGTGRVVQNIRGAAPVDRPPFAALANDSLILLVENRVEVYR
jgi:outer membrane protein assembly factor BamB/TolA-binding protein